MSDERDLIAERERKVAELRSAGQNPYANGFAPAHTAAQVHAWFAAGGAPTANPLTDEPPAPRFSVAGRIVALRSFGKAAFAKVRDRSGEIQVWVRQDVLGERTFAFWRAMERGDYIGAVGPAVITKTGERTLIAEDLRILTKAVRPLPEKWHGLQDMEIRYRQRYVDLIANPEVREVFRKRTAIIKHLRRFLDSRDFLEVETPAMHALVGGAAARPFRTHHNTLDLDLYLRISPELYLKRCLVGGLERVFELARCFRNEGISPRHNPEFTMLELYQAYGDYHDMMEICEAIIGGAARDVIGATRIKFGQHEIDYTTPWRRARYADLLREYAGLDINDRPAVLAKAQEIGLLAKLQKAQAALEQGVDPAKLSAPGMEQQPTPTPAQPGAAGAEFHVDHVLLVNALFEELVEQHLINPTFVLDYPAPLCPLTKRHPDDPSLALRFELYINGMEMGNAYSELNDPDVQRENLAGQIEGEGDETMRVMDEDFVESLEYGMPPAGGLGIGIDRMVMLLTGSTSIRDVILFPLQRPRE